MRGEVVPDQHDVELAELLLEMTPLERLQTLRRYLALREKAKGGDADLLDVIALGREPVTTVL